MTRLEWLVARGRQIVQQAKQLYIDFDLEADGVAGHGSILQIGAISPWGETFEAKLQPSSERFVPSQRKFCEAHGLRRDWLCRYGQNQDDVMRSFAVWAEGLAQRHNKTSIVLTAFNTGFDFPLVNLAQMQSGVISPFGFGGFCSQSYALAAFDHDWDKATIHWLAQEFGTPAELTHDALRDAKDQQIIHFVLAAHLEELRKR